MKFYTNVQLIGNQFLVRGVENGNRFEFRDEFFPTLFVKSKKKTKYRTCLLYTSPSPRDQRGSRMQSSA